MTPWSDSQIVRYTVSRQDKQLHSLPLPELLGKQGVLLGLLQHCSTHVTRHILQGPAQAKHLEANRQRQKGDTHILRTVCPAGDREVACNRAPRSWLNQEREAATRPASPSRHLTFTPLTPWALPSLPSTAQPSLHPSHAGSRMQAAPDATAPTARKGAACQAAHLTIRAPAARLPVQPRLGSPMRVLTTIALLPPALPAACAGTTRGIACQASKRGAGR